MSKSESFEGQESLLTADSPKYYLISVIIISAEESLVNFSCYKCFKIVNSENE
jgi:hypothetical protein